MASTLEITGPLKSLEYPPNCANCGMATNESLDVAKVFHRISDLEDIPNSFIVEHATVPFCPSCIARHQSEIRKLSTMQRLWITCHGREALGVPAYGVLALLVPET